MLNQIKFPRQPERPVCRCCVNYVGDTGTKRNGMKCCYCRALSSGIMITIKRGTRSAVVYPCSYYFPKNKLEVKR